MPTPATSGIEATFCLMKLKSFMLLVMIIPIASCAVTKKSASSFGNGNSLSTSIPKPTDDGLSYATAIVITEKSEMTGAKAEYEWIRSHYSDYRVKGQSLHNQDHKAYDIITIILSDGKELPLYFDISNFFGRF